MIKLINISTFATDLKRFEYDSERMTAFLKRNNLDGFEVLNINNWNGALPPKNTIKGVHLRYFPIWLDFWKENNCELINQFKTMDNVEKYYGGRTRDTIIEHYRDEITKASMSGAHYVVFHVSHVQLEHTYTHKFTYSDFDVATAAIELINEIFRGIKTEITLLLENLWWPGLTFLDKKIVEELLNRIEYPNKGFMLDTAHLMNTNPYLKNQEEGIEYILDTIRKIGDLKQHIKGLHLNCSLSGDYILQYLNDKSVKFNSFDFYNAYGEVFNHIFNIDRHLPFSSPKVRTLVEYINPDYLTYEFLSSSLSQLEEYISIQDKALK
ncbi:xylose isomerase [Fervidicella metallireducens AeB]|uniref:Xylose isomerase n=1 Tax=Fervidicella metallireducens AeB TaxID=1403537 RepID=A0A017S018_9CLOT|nr:TIM barrel protein [Fervidicella metallireducens]EYE89510.1 xylose isomerase [Fervidicella metallireducens AeB]